MKHKCTFQQSSLGMLDVKKYVEKKNLVSHQLSTLKIPHHHCEEFLGIAKDVVPGRDMKGTLVQVRGEILGLNQSLANFTVSCVSVQVCATFPLGAVGSLLPEGEAME